MKNGMKMNQETCFVTNQIPGDDFFVLKNTDFIRFFFLFLTQTVFFNPKNKKRGIKIRYSTTRLSATFKTQAETSVICILWFITSLPDLDCEEHIFSLIKFSTYIFYGSWFDLYVISVTILYYYALNFYFLSIDWPLIAFSSLVQTFLIFSIEVLESFDYLSSRANYSSTRCTKIWWHYCVYFPNVVYENKHIF